MPSRLSTEILDTFFTFFLLYLQITIIMALEGIMYLEQYSQSNDNANENAIQDDPGKEITIT